MPSTAGKNNWQRLTRTFVGLLLALLIFLAALWVAAPRLAEWQIYTELARLGVSVPELRIRSLTPWSLELEPLRLGEETDAPTLGALCVTYAPRELLHGKMRTVTLDGARLVIRQAKSGNWEIVGGDELLTKPAPQNAATPTKPLTPKEIMALLPDNISVRDVSVVVVTETGRREFPVTLNAVRNGDKMGVFLSVKGFGGTLRNTGTVMVEDKGWLAATGNYRWQPPPSVELGGVRFGSLGKLAGILNVNWDPKLNGCGFLVSATGGQAGGDGWNAKIEEMVACGYVAFGEKRAKWHVGMRGLSASLPGKVTVQAERLEGGFRENTADKDGKLVMEYTLYNMSLWIPQADAMLDGLDARLAVAWSEKSGLQSTIYEQRCSPNHIRSLKIRGVDFGKIPLQIKDEGTPLSIEAVLTPPGSAFSATVALSANLATRAIALSATLPPVAVSEKDPLLAPFLPPALKGAAFSGMVGGRADVTWQPGGEPQGTANLTLADGKFVAADAKYMVSGIDGKMAADLGANSATGTFTLAPPGSTLSATVALSANLATRAIALSATLPPATVSEKDPLLAPFLPPALKGAAFSGMVGGRADVTWRPGGEPKGTANLTLADGRFAMADGAFDVAGVECGLALESLVPLRSAPSQKLKFTLAHAAGTPLSDGKFAFRLDPPNTVFIEHGSFGWCGGRLTCAAARITNGKPDGMVMLRAEQVDVGQLLGLAKDFGGHAEGWLSGKVPLLFRADGMRLGKVQLFADPEKPGLLQLDPEKWPGNQVDTLGADPTVKKKMKLTLKDMNLSMLRLDALPGNQQEGTRLRLRLAGTPRLDSDLPPVDLTLNLNLEVRQNRLWELLNRSMQGK